MRNGNINKTRTTFVDGDDDWPADAYQPSRSDLLARYCYRTPRRFHQVTAWAACRGGSETRRSIERGQRLEIGNVAAKRTRMAVLPLFCRSSSQHSSLPNLKDLCRQ